jgi:transcriptional regulator with XRE-family HTH domain
VAQTRKKSKKDPDLVALGARVRELRLAAGMTQESLADAADLHWTFIGQVERGERNISYKNLLKIARGVGAEVSEVVGAEN